MPKHVVNRKDILRDFEIRGMVEQAPQPWLKCLLCLAWLFGKRITEILHVQRADVEVRDGYLYVRFHVGKKSSPKDRLAYVTYQKRITLMNEYTKPVLAYLDTVNMGALFPNVSRQLALYYLKKQNPNCYWHFFRESLATEMAERGATEEKLMHWFDWIV